MSNWINYTLDSKLVAKPFITPITNGGKGIMWKDDLNLYLGGFFLNFDSHKLPLQPPNKFNSLRVKHFYYN